MAALPALRAIVANGRSRQIAMPALTVGTTVSRDGKNEVSIISNDWPASGSRAMAAGTSGISRKPTWISTRKKPLPRGSIAMQRSDTT